MRLIIITLIFAPSIAVAGELIDARTLSVAQLMAMAAAERSSPSPLACCDWGGKGCLVNGKIVAHPDSAFSAADQKVMSDRGFEISYSFQVSALSPH